MTKLQEINNRVDRYQKDNGDKYGDEWLVNEILMILGR
jgi:hypothetical protein